jgi:hypothetical protein
MIVVETEKEERREKKMKKVVVAGAEGASAEKFHFAESLSCPMEDGKGKKTVNKVLSSRSFDFLCNQSAIMWREN